MIAAQPPAFKYWAREAFAVPKVLAAPFRNPAPCVAFGQGRPAIVIPGMLSGDRSTALLRKSLAVAGFEPAGWGNGFNVKVSEAAVRMVEQQLLGSVRNAEKPALIIGWSLGGFYARMLAQRHPALVSMVVTLGTPFSGNRRANNAWRLYEFLNDHSVDHPPFHEDISAKPPVKTVAIWSPTDGIVAPQSACGRKEERDAEYMVPFSHFELGTSKPAIAHILEILRQELTAV